MIAFKHYGSFKNTEKFLNQSTSDKIRNILNKYGKDGVNALAASTPVDSGTTAQSWYYEVKVYNSTCSLTWCNSNVINGVPIAILIQYGHGTKNGGYVEGRDYINPAIRPIMDKIANEAWREVTNV